MDYLKVYLISKRLTIFLFFFSYYLEFDSTVVTMHTLRKFNYFNFVEVYFMAQNIVYLGVCPMDYWKECLFCCCAFEWFLNVNEILLVDDVVEFFHILAGFMSSYSINFWERNAKFPNYNYGFVYFSTQFYQFLLHIFVALLFGAYTFRIVIFFVENFLSLHNVLLCVW